MSSNPYEPPRSPLRTAALADTQPARGVLAALAVYLGGSFALQNLLALLVIWGDAGRFDVALQLALTHVLDPASAAGVLSTMLALVLSFLSGYVCAAVSRVRSLIGPTVVATVCMSLDLFFGPGSLQTGVWIGLAALSFLLTLFGGFAWLRHASRELAPGGF